MTNFSRRKFFGVLSGTSAATVLGIKSLKGNVRPATKKEIKNLTDYCKRNIFITNRVKASLY